MAMSVQTAISTTPAIGYAGMLDPAYPSSIITGKNTAAVSLPFGYAVKYDASSPTSDADMNLPAAETDTVAGIILHGHHYARAWTGADGVINGELDATGLKIGVIFNLLVAGRVLVVCEDGCIPGDKLWVRCTAGGAGEVVGGLNSADEGTETIPCTGQGTWRSTAAAGGLAWLEVDFANPAT